MFFWVELPAGVDSDALLSKAIERGVAFVPGTSFFAVAPRSNTLRLSFVTVAAEAIERGIASLAAALRDLQAESGARGPVAGVAARSRYERVAP